METLGPTFLNVEYLFFLLYRLFRGIVNIFVNLFSGFRGKNHVRDFYSKGDFETCNPFLGDVCSSSGATSSGEGISSGGFFESVSGFGFGLRVFLIFLILLLLTIAIYSMIRWYEIKRQADKYVENLIPKEPIEERENKRWKHVQELIASNNPNDWRLAIIEADSMLEDMTRAMNIPGDTLGERLKSIEPSDFLTLQNAWEAHKVRNQIAHQGSAFQLDHRTALAAIKNFEAVFREFEVI